MLKTDWINKDFIYQMEPWIGEEEVAAVTNYLRSGGWLTEFKKTTEFEEAIASYVGSKYAVAVSNGTVSLSVALMALGIGTGDEVLVPNLSMIASANAVILAGAKPVLVDIEPNTLCIDFQKAEESITTKTKALMLVSLNGRSPNMTQAINFCKRHKIFLVEDAAQSLGSRWNGRHLGTFGIVGSFSFSAPKIITTGQGGALVTDSSTLFAKIRKIKDFGRIKGGVDEHTSLGYNFKFNDILAVIGLEQFKKLDFRVKRKKEIYQLYKDELSELKQINFIETDLSDTTPWFIDILIKNRDEPALYLQEKGIGTRKFYPPIHSQSPYNNMIAYQKRDYPVSSNISERGLWLPSSSFLSDRKIRMICSEIKSFYSAS